MRVARRRRNAIVRAASHSIFRGSAPVAPVDRKTVSRLLVAGLVIGAVGLAGCGRKGALEPPPGVAAAPATVDGQPPLETPPKPDKPFFLDPLLD